MPRFGIKAQITLLSLGLLSIPWFAWSYWQEIQQAAITAQGRVQLIETKAIATSLVATQENIALLLADDDNSDLEKHALSAPSISKPIRLDGQLSDWNGQQALLNAFDSSFSIWQANPDTPAETAFGLALAQTENHLYIALNVRDDLVQERKPNHLRLDYNDHVQLTYQDGLGAIQRVLIPAQGEGDLASYFTDFGWRYGVDNTHPISGDVIASHITGLQGYWRNTASGYAIELRMPTSALNNTNPRLHIAVVDVDDTPSYGPSAIVASLPKQLESELNPLGLHARELQRVIEQLKTTYARLWVFDRQGREWAYGGREAHDSIQPLAFDTQCVQDALLNNDSPIQYVSNTDGELERIIACHPIIDQKRVLGVVVIDESAKHVLAQEEDKIQAIATRLVLAVVFVVLLFFAYSVALARRIARLNSESKSTIDQHGRIEITQLEASKGFPDEIGDLSRTISGLLQKQQSYTEFLERIPQTLRHEIANPLNKLRTSLELLLETRPELADDRFIKRLEAGTDQINQITTHLTEAASLEGAIQSERLNSLDLNQFLRGYFDSWGAPVLVNDFRTEPFELLGDSTRLEQLFDKLMDNATSYCSENGAVTITVKQEKHFLQVDIENDGPSLATDNLAQLFAPMSTSRSSGGEIHLGLGLHIAKLIAEKHGANILAKNRSDGSGVVFSVLFKR